MHSTKLNLYIQAVLSHITISIFKAYKQFRNHI